MTNSPLRRILLIGAQGQIGWELARTLAPLGTVVATTRADLDLAQPERIRSAVRRIAPTAIVNAAAYTAVDRAEAEPALARAINGTAPGVLADEAARAGALLVHYSTDYVFDGTRQTPYAEDDPPNPQSVYGETKLLGEQAIRAAGGAHLIFRTAWVYGRRGGNFLRTVLRLAREREELRIVDDQIGAPTWSRGIAEATALVLARVLDRSSDHMDPSASGVYHLSAAGQTSWYGFARAVVARDPRPAEQICARVVPIATRQYPTPARRPAYSVLDNTRIGDRFGVRLPEWDSQLDLALGPE